MGVQATERLRARAVAAALLAILLLAFALRALGFEQVFLDDGSVAFRLADAQYHVRRALWTLHHFPSVLTFDPYINFPAGSSVPYPPLWDLFLAAVALVLGGSQSVFERVAGWAPAVVGALTVWPIYVLGRRARGAGLGLGAAAIYACLPIGVTYSEVGNPDHHAAVALLGTALVARVVAVLDRPRPGRTLVPLFAGLVALRCATLLLWQGSLLYLGLGEIAIVVYAAQRGRSDLLLAQALSTAATAALVAPVVWSAESAVGGPYSAIELSRLHLLAYACAALVAGGAAALERWRPAGSAGGRLLRVVLVAAGLGVALLALPETREGMGHALAWVTKADAYGEFNVEQRPLLWTLGAEEQARAELMLGWYAYLVPLAPLALLWEARRRTEKAPLLLLAAWCAVAGLLALSQVRYGNDFAPVGSLGFALLVANAARFVSRPLRAPSWLGSGVAVALGAALLWPAFAKAHTPRALRTLAHLQGKGRPGDRALHSVEGSLMRFAQAVRAVTPETSGFHDSGVRPEYGILGLPAIGHVLHYRARRATPADNFGPYIGRANFEAARSFFMLESEREAFERARGLQSRYVVTTAISEQSPTLGWRLHGMDGSADGPVPQLEHFRLVTEGPRGGIPLGVRFGRRLGPDVVPYKLFEVVEGAVLEVRTDPGGEVSASLWLLSPLGRGFRYRATARADAQGLARLRVAYASRTELPTRGRGPYQLKAGERRWEVEVTDSDVREGRTIDVGDPEA